MSIEIIKNVFGRKMRGPFESKYTTKFLTDFPQAATMVLSALVKLYTQVRYSCKIQNLNSELYIFDKIFIGTSVFVLRLPKKCVRLPIMGF